jgi:hypothetical protein
MAYQHISFSITFKNVDAADPRCGTETVLDFGGIRYDAAGWDDDTKECALFHCCDAKVLAALASDFGKVRPLPRTFVLKGVHTPSDQGFAA